jgi:ABC-type sugar transport system substrate-binding protein
MTDTFDRTRRDFLTVATAGGAVATLGMLGAGPALAGIAAGRSEKPLKAAFSNAGLQATWCAQGKAAAEYWGKLFNVEVTWFDGQLDAVKQRAAVDNIASQKWDFVAIQAFGIGTLTQPVQKMIDGGTPVIDMDTLIAPLDKINVHSFLAPDNEFMGSAVTQALVAKLGGKGKVIMTQGALGHTGAQGRAKGFQALVAARGHDGLKRDHHATVVESADDVIGNADITPPLGLLALARDVATEMIAAIGAGLRESAAHAPWRSERSKRAREEARRRWKPSPPRRQRWCRRCCRRRRP